MAGCLILAALGHTDPYHRLLMLLAETMFFAMLTFGLLLVGLCPACWATLAFFGLETLGLFSELRHHRRRLAEDENFAEQRWEQERAHIGRENNLAHYQGEIIDDLIAQDLAATVPVPAQPPATEEDDATIRQAAAVALAQAQDHEIEEVLGLEDDADATDSANAQADDTDDDDDDVFGEAEEEADSGDENPPSSAASVDPPESPQRESPS